MESGLASIDLGQEASDEAERFPHDPHPPVHRSPQMTVLAVALLIGFGGLAGLAVFYYFGGYWRKLWRQRRLALAGPHDPISLNATEKK